MPPQHAHGLRRGELGGRERPRGLELRPSCHVLGKLEILLAQSGGWLSRRYNEEDTTSRSTAFSSCTLPFPKQEEVWIPKWSNMALPLALLMSLLGFFILPLLLILNRTHDILTLTLWPPQVCFRSVENLSGKAWTLLVGRWCGFKLQRLTWKKIDLSGGKKTHTK